MKNALRIAMCQINNRMPLEQLFNKVLLHIEMAHQKGVNIICFPELTFSQLNMLDIEEDAQFLNGPIVSWLCEKAKKYQINIIAGLIEKNEQFDLFNTAVYISEKGIVVSAHHKVNLNNYEKTFIKQGTNIVSFETGYGSAVILIGNDILSFDLFLQISKLKPTFIFCLMQVPKQFHYSINASVVARVLEADSFFIVTSNIGIHEIARLEFVGYSRALLNPLHLGKEDARCEDDIIITTSGNHEELLIADCDVESLKESQIINLGANYLLNFPTSKAGADA